MPKTTTGDRGRDSPGTLPLSDPFQTYFDVPVAGGALRVARAGTPPEADGTVVLVVHGMTSCHMGYRTVARELCSTARPMCVLAPDLRGRGRSAHLPEPYGMAAHVADLIAVLDCAGADRAVVVGHSMGCNIAARFAADHPERAAAVVLLDGGLPLLSEQVLPDDAEEGDSPGLLDRLDMTFATVEENLAYWRSHPSLQNAWHADIDAFVRYDLVEDEDGVRCVVNRTAVQTDIADLLIDGVTWTAVTRLRTPVRLMRAERGLFDDDPVIPLPELDEFLRHHPHVSVEMVPDVNHYTILMGGGHGPRRVAATVAELADENLRGT
ncbi:MAG: alpha/beta hydrolase [Solirubrobacterales bacterium]|nr:alpha/beta hydrolase [Solirubrobacterales bacterium]